MKLNETFNKANTKHLGLTKFDLAFDVGSYTGDSISGLKSLGYKNIICFEPDPSNFINLKLNYGQDPQISCIRKAVTNKSNEIVKMYSTRNLPFLNTLDKNWIIKTRHKQYYRPTQWEEFDVETTTLDDFVKSIGKTPSYVKIDVEGHEREVLDGMSFKPEFLSFEWISEKLNNNLECIYILMMLGFKKFTVCFGEDIPIKGQVWHDHERITNKFYELKEADKDNNFSGNIFCL